MSPEEHKIISKSIRLLENKSKKKNIDDFINISLIKNIWQRNKD